MNMNKLTKILLCFEILIGFGFIVCLWLFCSLMAIFQLFFSVIAYGNLHDLVYTYFSLAGGVGLFGFAQLSMQVFLPYRKNMLSPLIILMLLTIGIATIAYFIWPISQITAKSLFLFLPIIVTFHFLYLARKKFLPTNS